MDAEVTLEGQRIEVLGKSESLQNHYIYYVSGTCSLSAGVDFLKEIMKTKCQESSLLFFSLKNIKNHRHDPKVVPKILQMMIPDWSLFPLGAPLGFFGVLGGPGLPK